MTAPLFPPVEAKRQPVSAFDEFYARYPRKVGIGAARKAYAKALKTAQHDDIMFGLSEQLASMEAKDKQFIPHASTWLNQERWTDEPEEPNSMAGTRRANGNPGSDQIAIAARGRRAPSQDCF